MSVITLHDKNSLLRLANDGFDAIFYLLEDGNIEAAMHIADAFRSLPEGQGDDPMRMDLTIANIESLLQLHPDLAAVQIFKPYAPRKRLIRPIK